MSIWSPMDLDAWERIAVEGAMQYCRGVKLQASRVLNIAPRTLDAKLEKYAAEDKKKQELENERRKRQEDFNARARAAPPQFRGSLDIGFDPTKVFEEPAPTPAAASRPAGKSASAESGVHVESDAGLSRRKSVPVQKDGKAVPEVLPGQVANRRTDGRG